MGIRGEKRVFGRLAAVASREPRAVELFARVASPDVLTSPLSGKRAVLVHVELLERDGDGPVERLLGTIVLGAELVVLRDLDGAELTLVARRARIHVAARARVASPLDCVPAELVPLLRGATGRGGLFYRELALVGGDEVRVKAIVEPRDTVVGDGHGSSTRVSYVAREDLGPVVLEELFDGRSG